MAELSLPGIIVMEPAAGNSSGYACYTAGGDVLCTEKSVFSTFAKIEVERAQVDAKYVHLRFYHSNKYWARSPEENWIVAVSNKREEDKSKLTCTLFEPTFGKDDGLLHLTHVQSGRRLRTDSETNRVYVDNDGGHAFAIVDWNMLVNIPKRVAFKGVDDGKYLQAVRHGSPSLQFSSSEGNHGNEVHLHSDGHVRIKSEHFGVFWRRGPGDNWIWADSSDESGTDINTLFWPAKGDNSSRPTTITLRSAGNNNTCHCFTSEGSKADGLTASSKSAKEAKLVVIEPAVLERKIFEVAYRMEDGWVFDEQPMVLGTGSATNLSHKEIFLTIKVSYEDTRSYSFTNSITIHTGVKSTFQAAIPSIAADGKSIVVISPETTINPFEWGVTIHKKQTEEATCTVKVPASSRVTVKYVGTLAKCSLPFLYTQEDTMSSDDEIQTATRNIDGIFHGAYLCNLHFDLDQLLIESL